MTTSGNPKNAIETMQRYQFVFREKLSQNLLIDIRVLDRIIGAAGITEDDCVLGIGPGIDIITQYLAEHTEKVVAVEIDTNLLPILGETLRGYPNVTVINNDILKLDMDKLVDEYNDGRPIKVAANLSYYITTPIVVGLFKSNVPVDNITVMVQKEVADRMQVGLSSRDYSALSLAARYYAKPYTMANVPPNCFIPRPNVGSAAIRFTRYQEPPVQVNESGIMFRLIRTSFNQRRETLQNGLNDSSEIPYTKGQTAFAIEGPGVPASVRGGTLTLEQFASLTNYFTRTTGKEANGS